MNDQWGFCSVLISMNVHALTERRGTHSGGERAGFGSAL